MLTHASIFAIFHSLPSLFKGAGLFVSPSYSVMPKSVFLPRRFSLAAGVTNSTALLFGRDGHRQP